MQYEYQATAKPELSKLKVFSLIWPSNVVRAQLGSRAGELPALMMPALFPGVPEPSKSSDGCQCLQPQWSEFVSSKSAGATPVRALPFELAQVHSIDIQSDIDGLAGRIATVLHAKVPALRVRTVHDRASEPSDATLDFRAECRCNERGAPLTAFTCARPFSTSTEVSESAVSRLACCTTGPTLVPRPGSQKYPLPASVRRR